MFFNKYRIRSRFSIEDRCFKRKISKMSVNSDPGTKRSLDSEADHSSSSFQNKRQKTLYEPLSLPHNYKSSIQCIYEMTRIQPVKFELICQAGQAHKPTFKFCLTMQISGKSVHIYSTGPSKKIAKLIASLKAISYLIDLPDFFISEEKEFFKYLIELEVKIYKLESSLLQETIYMSEVEDFESALIIDVPESEPNGIPNPDFDPKTKEIIATKNPLSILNHLLPKKLFNDNIIEESGQSHSRIFKVEIRINKQDLADSNLQIKHEIFNLTDNHEQNLSLFKNTEDELIFYGKGSTKKIAKSRAAQYLLEILFNIKLTNPGNYILFYFFKLNRVYLNWIVIFTIK